MGETAKAKIGSDASQSKPRSGGHDLATHDTVSGETGTTVRLKYGLTSVLLSRPLYAQIVSEALRQPPKSATLCIEGGQRVDWCFSGHTEQGLYQFAEGSAAVGLNFTGVEYMNK